MKNSSVIKIGLVGFYTILLPACFLPTSQNLKSITTPGADGEGNSPDSENKYVIYSSNNGSGSLSISLFSTSTSKLTSIETKSDTSTSPEKIEIKNDNLYLAGNWTDAKITHYKIDIQTGKLTKVLDYTDAPDPRNLVIKGDYIYAINFLNPGKISKYKIESNGSLSGFVNYNTAASKPRSLAFHPNLDILYTAGLWDWKVYEQSINPGTGALTETNNIGTQNDPTCIELSGDGKFAFSCNGGANSISSYSVNSSTGALSLVGHFPSVGTSPYTLEANTDASCIYVSNTGNKALETFSASSGTLTHIESKNYGTGSVGGIKILDEYLFASHLDGYIRVHKMESDCRLNLVDEYTTGETSAFDIYVYKIP